MCLCMRINEQLLKGGGSTKNLGRHPPLTSRSPTPTPPPPPPHLLSLIKDRILTKNNLVSTARVTLIQRNGQRGRYLIYDNCNVLGYISSLPNLLMVIIVYRVFRNGRSLSSWKPYTLSLSLIRSCMNLPVSPMYTLPHSQGRLILYSILFSWINRILRSY